MGSKIWKPVLTVISPREISRTSLRINHITDPNTNPSDIQEELVTTTVDLMIFQSTRFTQLAQDQPSETENFKNSCIDVKFQKQLRNQMKNTIGYAKRLLLKVAE